MSPKEVYILLRKKCPDFFSWVTGLAVLTSSPLPASLTLFQRHCHSCCFFNMPGTFFPQISVHGLPLFFHFSAQISSPRSRLPWHPAHPDILSFCPALFSHLSIWHSWPCVWGGVGWGELVSVSSAFFCSELHEGKEFCIFSEPGIDALHIART